MTDGILNLENLELLAKAQTEESATEGALSDASAEPEREIIFEEALEAVLFAAGHPISYATLARVFDMTPAKVKDKVFEYSVIYNNPDIPRGVMLLTFADTCQLCTKQYYLHEIRDALGIKKSGSLSTSSMEALAIIAYNQPVTRIFVDTLRRVDSSYAMNNLLDRGLIESKGRMDAPGRPMLYGTTADFLRCFGLKDLASLPKTSDELLEVFNKVKISDAPADSEDAENSAPQMEMDIDSITEAHAEGTENSANNESEAEFTAELEPSADDDIVDD